MFKKFEISEGGFFALVHFGGPWLAVVRAKGRSFAGEGSRAGQVRNFLFLGWFMLPLRPWICCCGVKY